MKEKACGRKAGEKDTSSTFTFFNESQHYTHLPSKGVWSAVPWFLSMLDGTIGRIQAFCNDARKAGHDFGVLMHDFRLAYSTHPAVCSFLGGL